MKDKIRLRLLTWKLMRLLMRLKAWYRWQRLKLCRLLPMRVLLDADDGTVTLNRGVLTALAALAVNDRMWSRVHMFTVKASHRMPCGYDRYYCFALDPCGVRGIETNYYEVQVASNAKCAGFYPTCPTVPKMMYDYGYAHLSRVVLVVRMEMCKGQVYFRIIPESARWGRQ